MKDNMDFQCLSLFLARLFQFGRDERAGDIQLLVTTKQKSAKSSMFWLWELPSRGKLRNYQNNAQAWQPGGARAEQRETWAGAHLLLSAAHPALCWMQPAGADTPKEGRLASSGSGALKFHAGSQPSRAAPLPNSPPSGLRMRGPSFSPQPSRPLQSEMHHSGLYLQVAN